MRLPGVLLAVFHVRGLPEWHLKLQTSPVILPNYP